MRECYVDASGCVVCPELPAVAAQPATRVTDPRFGWNAGANSIDSVSGDLHVVDAFTDQAPMGIVVGLRDTRDHPENPDLILHGLYFFKVAGQPRVRVCECGTLVGDSAVYTLGTDWEIRRVGNRVSYWNAGVMLAETAARAVGPVVVTACLYAGGDELP